MELHEDQEMSSQEERDRVALLSIFPIEVWKMILERFDSDQLYTMIQATPFFRTLLHPNLKFILFPTVYQILRNYKKNREENCGANALVPKEINTTKSEFDLYASSPLNLRLVCSVWCESLNELHEDQEPDNISDTSVEANSSELYVFSEIYDGGCEDVRQFLDHFDDSHPAKTNANPFIGRKIKLIYTYHQDSDPQLIAENTCIIRMLEMYGHHVNSCTIILKHRFNSSLLRVYDVIERWLNCMPNLKRTEINVPTNQITKFPLDEEFISSEQPLMDIVMKVLVIPNIDSRLSNYEEVEHLAYDFYEANDCGELEIMCQQRDNPDQIILADTVIQSVRYLQNHFSDNQNLADYGYRAEFKVKSTPLVKTLINETVSGKLKLVSLNLYMGYYYPIDFILPIYDTLQILQVTLGFKIPVSRNVDQKIEFIGFESRMLESNIWSLFQKLTKLVIVEEKWRPPLPFNLSLVNDDDKALNENDVKVYSRQEWEARVAVPNRSLTS